MVCLDNSSHYYDFVVAVNVFAYFGVFLPNFGRLASLLYGLNFGVLSVAVLQAVWPASVPDNQLAYVSLNLTAFSLFSLLGNALGSISLIVGTLLLLGPLAIAGREHLHHWFDAQLGLHLSDASLLALVSGLWLALTLAYSAAERNRALQVAGLSLLYSLLAVFGAKVIFIEYVFQSDFDRQLLCCGGKYANKTCPFVLDLWFGLSLALAFLLRLALARKWLNRHSLKPKAEPAEDDRSDDPESQALLGLKTDESRRRAEALAAQPAAASSRFVSRYLPSSRWR